MVYILYGIYYVIKIEQYSEHRNSVKNHCRRTIKKTFESLKSLPFEIEIEYN